MHGGRVGMNTGLSQYKTTAQSGPALDFCPEPPPPCGGLDRQGPVFIISLLSILYTYM